eukprot:4115422-Amphidinium_carterae.1
MSHIGELAAPNATSLHFRSARLMYQQLFGNPRACLAQQWVLRLTLLVHIATVAQEKCPFVQIKIRLACCTAT